jgi:hypothetical protein
MGVPLFEMEALVTRAALQPPGEERNRELAALEGLARRRGMLRLAQMAAGARVSR